MHVTHRKRFVSRDLVALAARHSQELAALSEAHYHDQIESIADEFCEAVVDGHVKSFVAGVVGFCCVAFVNRRSQTNGLWLWFENRVFPLTVR